MRRSFYDDSKLYSSCGHESGGWALLLENCTSQDFLACPRGHFWDFMSHSCKPTIATERQLEHAREPTMEINGLNEGRITSFWASKERTRGGIRPRSPSLSRSPYSKAQPLLYKGFCKRHVRLLNDKHRGVVARFYAHLFVQEDATVCKSNFSERSERPIRRSKACHWCVQS